MGRTPKDEFDRGAWTSLEDKMLSDYVSIHGQGKWSNVAKKTGLKRCGKSCRLRWLNYLRPDIKRGNISRDEEELIVRLHKLLGNRWSLIAGRLPGRTDNEIKNYWNSNLVKKIEHFQLPLPKLTPPPPVTVSEAIEPASFQINPPDFSLDFNMDELCHILDAPAANINKMGREEEDKEMGECDGNNNNDSDYDQLLNDSDFMSDILPFFDSDQVLDWTGMA